MTYVVMAYIVMAYIVMAYIVMAYAVMAYIGMAYIVMALRHARSGKTYRRRHVQPNIIGHRPCRARTYRRRRLACPHAPRPAAE